MSMHDGKSMGNLGQVRWLLSKIGCEHLTYRGSRFLVDRLDLQWILEVHQYDENIAVLEEYVSSDQGYVGVHLVVVRGSSLFLEDHTHSGSFSLGYLMAARQCPECSLRARACPCPMEWRVFSRLGGSPVPGDWASFTARHGKQDGNFPIFWKGSFGEGHGMGGERQLSLEKTSALKEKLVEIYFSSFSTLPHEPQTDILTAKQDHADQSTKEGAADHTCAACRRSFSRKSALARHSLAVHENQTYECPKCDCRFNSSSNLQRHVQNVHCKVLAFQCSVCGYPFSSKFNANRHLQRKHDGAGQIICNRSPITEKSLEIFHFCAKPEAEHGVEDQDQL
uniref:C2H2-type domain-containing protein n=1 Tax=Compsopogon caeruleus TaxID=31354 RepID=A0A7S1TCL4_9RHOD|mmetsp:Transcript_16734/g.34461  ORF Transcript_16734/g.34461 Transcript_16734/m.34461 type:complete len:337 (+) Transcript_16734:574-1584(+)